jgi:hypothetical protein
VCKVNQKTVYPIISITSFTLPLLPAHPLSIDNARLTFIDMLCCDVVAVFVLIPDGQMTTWFALGGFTVPPCQAADGQFKEIKRQHGNVPDPSPCDAPIWPPSEVVSNAYPSKCPLQQMAIEKFVPINLSDMGGG